MSRVFSILLHIMAALLALLLTLGELLVIAYSFNIYTPPEPEARSDILAITAATLIDGTGTPPLENTTILISRDRIWRIESGGHPPSGAQVIDVAGRFVLPALTDAALFFEAPVGEEMAYSPGEWAWDITRALPAHRRALLGAGITTAQDIGGNLDSSVRRRLLIQRQELAGPRLFVSGPILKAPQGFPDQQEFPFRPREVSAVVESPDQGRQWVQQLADANVDLISISFTSLGEERPKFSAETLSAIIDEAHTYGRRVIVYTAALEEAREAVTAGADALVGGVTLIGEQIDGDLLSLMADQGTVYIPALAAAEARQASGSTHDSLEVAQDNARLAYRAGIAVVAGSVAVGRDMGFGSSLHSELSLLVAAGLTPEEAIRCATVEAARFLHAESMLGTVKEGGLADLVILNANPLDDIRALDQVAMVIQNGVIVIDQLDEP